MSDPLPQAHRLGAEDARVHGPHVPDDRPELHVGQDVLVDIDPRRGLDQLQPLRPQPEDATLGDVEHRLVLGRRHLARKRDLLDALVEFLRPCPPARCEAARPRSCRSRPPAVNVPANTTLRAFWLMLMKPPAPASFGPKRLTLTLPCGVRLRHAEEREVEPAAVVEIELLVLVDDGLGVDRRAEIETRRRHAADHARLGGERDELVDALLGRDRGDALRHADAEVDDGAGPQLHRAAPGDDLALVQRHRLDALQRHADFGAVGRIVDGRVGLPVMLRVRHDHAIDQRSRHEHLARMQRAGARDPLHLHDHDAARVLDRHRHREIVEVERLALRRDVAVRVGGGAAQESDVEREAAVEQPLLAVDLHHPDEVFGGDGVDLAALEPRIDEGADADAGERAGLAGGDVAVEVRDHALRQVVGLDLALEREAADLRDQAPMAADHALEQAVVAERVEAAVLAVPLPGGEQQREVARLAGFEEALFERDQKRIRHADADEA